MIGNPYNPELPHPFPSGGTIPRQLFKTVAAAATPEALGADKVLLKSLLFTAIPSLGGTNVGNVYIQTRNSAGVFVDAYELVPGAVIPWAMADGESIRASDFKIRVATDGDGVQVMFHQR